MKTRILILGAGFGGLELSTLLSESLGESVEVTLIDKNDHFIYLAYELPYQRFACSLTLHAHDSGPVWLATPSP